MLHQTTATQLLKRLESIAWGTLQLTTPDGKQYAFKGKTQSTYLANIHVHDWQVFTNVMKKGDIGFADDYREGRWDTDDIKQLVELCIRNQAALDDMLTGSFLYRTIAALSYLFRCNSVKGSKKNIHAHYDLGNDFYQLWLDPSMTYSSALFQSDSDSLTKAQYQKYDRMLDCLDANSGRLLEIGCGWGGLAERAINRGDFGVKGITLSREQHDYAKHRLGNDAEIVLEDYRHQTGLYDRIISIEMFEAVGEQYWATYFSKVKSLLAKNGKAVVQTITMNEKDFPRYRRGGDFIRSFIFPGGMLPSIPRFKQEAEKAGLKVHQPFTFGLDYAKTLDQWLLSFNQQSEAITSLGFDEGFKRLWRFYLAACSAGFVTNKTDVIQVELSHA